MSNVGALGTACECGLDLAGTSDSADEGEREGWEEDLSVKWMMGEAEWDVMSMYSVQRSRVLRIRRAFSWRAARAEGVEVKMEIASEAATARSAGRAAEKTNEVPLMRCYGRD
jgi:hypothetical protein